MKKFYALLVAVLVVAAAFAQKGKGVQARPVPFQLGLQKSLVAKPTKQKFAVSKKVLKAPEETSQNYVRVNSTPESWEGDYLIVYEDGKLAMNGGLTDKLDVVSNTVAVTIADGEIASSEAMDAASFSIKEVDGGYSIQGKGGLYMGWANTEKNGLDSSPSEQYVNTLSLDGDGNANIVSSCGSYFRYNTTENQNRFRYFKASTYTNMKPVALYKKGGEKTEIETPELVVLPDGLEPVSYAMVGQMYFVYDDATDKLNETIKVAFSGNDVYVQGICYWFEDSWVKGTIVGNKVVFESNQFMGEDEEGTDYLVGLVEGEDGLVYSPTFEFDYDAETGVMTMSEDYTYGDVPTKDSDKYWNYTLYMTLTPGEAEQPEAVVVPENLVVAEYKLSATARNYESEGDDEESEEEEENYTLVETPYTSRVMVGFDGNDVYFKGLSSYLPEGWAKGTLSEDGKTVTIPSEQFLGTYEIAMFDFSDDLYITAVDLETQEYKDVVFNYNAETKTFSTAQDIKIVNYDEYYYEWAVNVSMVKLDEFAATPATPSIVYFDNDEEYPGIKFEIPTTDTQDRDILTSKLFYVIYIEKDGQQQKLTLDASLYKNITEDMIEVPYTFNDDWDFVAGTMLYLNQGAEEFSTWTKIGIQSVYYGGGERHESEIGWMEIESGEYEDAINDVNTVRNGAAVYYDMQGRSVSKPTRGIYVVNGHKVVIK